MAVNTGTAALHAAAWAACIGLGDEVIVPAISFCGQCQLRALSTGNPVFADLCSDTLISIPPMSELKITPKTRAIVAVDSAGHPCDHDALRQLTPKPGFLLLLIQRTPLVPCITGVTQERCNSSIPLVFTRSNISRRVRVGLF